MDDYLAKPITAEAFFEVLERLTIHPANAGALLPLVLDGGRQAASKKLPDHLL